MVGETDREDKNESRKIAIALIGILLVAGIALLLLMPELFTIIARGVAPGLGLRDAAIIAFFITLVLIVIFAIASGDGLLGEVQFILPGFLIFFLIIWLMSAWVF